MAAQTSSGTKNKAKLTRLQVDTSVCPAFPYRSKCEDLTQGPALQAPQIRVRFMAIIQNPSDLQQLPVTSLTIEPVERKRPRSSAALIILVPITQIR